MIAQIQQLSSSIRDPSGLWKGGGGEDGQGLGPEPGALPVSRQSKSRKGHRDGNGGGGGVGGNEGKRGDLGSVGETSHTTQVTTLAPFSCSVHWFANVANIKPYLSVPLSPRRTAVNSSSSKCSGRETPRRGNATDSAN